MTTTLRAPDRTEDADRVTGETAASEHAVREISVFELLNVVIRNRSLILLLALAVGTAGGILALLAPEKHVASGIILPQGTEQGMRESGLVAQLLSRSGTATMNSPEYYAGLLTTRPILTSVAARRFTVTTPGGETHAGTLAELYAAAGLLETATIEGAAGILRGAITVEGVPGTSMVKFAAEAPWPALAEQLVSSLFEVVNEFNVSTRQSEAAVERQFIDSRLAETREQLVSAEEAMAKFLVENRQFQNSPRLSFEYERLQRQVQLQQQLYVQLAQSFENARIAEVRDIPVFTVVEPAEGSARAQRPVSLAVMVTTGVLLGGMLALLIVIVREFMGRLRSSPRDEVREFVALQQEVVEDLRSFARRIMRRRRAREP